MPKQQRKMAANTITVIVVPMCPIPITARHFMLLMPMAMAIAFMCLDDCIACPITMVCIIIMGFMDTVDSVQFVLLITIIAICLNMAFSMLICIGAHTLCTTDVSIPILMCCPMPHGDFIMAGLFIMDLLVVVVALDSIITTKAEDSC